MIRGRFNQRHDEFVVQVACWCLQRGLWVRWSAQEVSAGLRFEPDLELYSAELDRRVYVEVKVSDRRNVAIGLDELLHQRTLSHPVVVVARAGSKECGFLLRSTLPDYVYVPDGADEHLAGVAKEISARWGVPLRRTRANSPRDGSNIPFALYLPSRFRHWHDVVASLMEVKSSV